MRGVTQKWYNDSHLKGVSLRATNARDVSNHTNLKGDAMNNDTSETVLIPLTKGQVAKVSPEDADLAQFKWYAKFDSTYAGGGKYKAAHSPSNGHGRSKTELMHRVILSRMLGRPLLRSEKVDHIHGNTLDNRRSEIRLATNAQNCSNKGKMSTNTSGYKGVSWHKRIQKWSASIQSKGKLEHLGYFDDVEEAYEAYKIAAVKYHGEFARFE